MIYNVGKSEKTQSRLRNSTYYSTFRIYVFIAGYLPPFVSDYRQSADRHLEAFKRRYLARTGVAENDVKEVERNMEDIFTKLFRVVSLLKNILKMIAIRS